MAAGQLTMPSTRLSNRSNGLFGGLIAPGGCPADCLEEPASIIDASPNTSPSTANPADEPRTRLAKPAHIPPTTPAASPPATQVIRVDNPRGTLPDRPPTAGSCRPTSVWQNPNITAKTRPKASP